MTVTRLIAPAKLTLSLRVTGVRSDGYHLIDAEMVSINLCDELLLSKCSDLVVRSAGSGLEIPVTENNLVTRALDLVDRKAGVTIEKKIPAELVWEEVQQTPPRSYDGLVLTTRSRLQLSEPM